MVEFTYQMVLSTLQTAGILVGIAYYLVIMRNSQRNQQLQLETRQAQLFMQMYNKWHTLELRTQLNNVMASEWKDYDDFIEYSANIETITGFYIVASFFEGIGVLVHRGLIEATLVDDLMSGAMMRYWEKLEPIAYEIRKRRNWPQWGEWVEYLYNQIKDIYERQHPELQNNP